LEAPVSPTEAPIEAVPPAPIPPELSRRMKLLREIVDTAILTAVVFLLVNAATSRFQIESVSMQPSLFEGERLIVDKISYRLGAPQRGDIVVFTIVGEPKDLIKRVIGLPGDTIEIAEGVVYIDGLRLDEPYVELRSGDAYSARKLGTDEYFVMGDNRGNSRDSRVFGPIQLSSIVGRAWLIYWPVANLGLVPRPAYASGDAR